MCSAKYIHAYHAIPLDNTIQCEQFSRKRSLAECAGNLFNLTLAILSIFKSREAVIDRLRGLIKGVLQRIKVKKRPIVWVVINSVFSSTCHISSGIIPPEHLTFISLLSAKGLYSQGIEWNTPGRRRGEGRAKDKIIALWTPCLIPKK